MLIGVYGRESAALHVAVVALLELPSQIAVLALHHGVDGIWLGQVVLLPGNDVGMDMGHALACILAVLYGNVEGRGIEDAFNGARDALDRQEEVLDFGGRQVIEARDDAAWRDEDVTGQERLEVHESVRQRREVEDLEGGPSASARHGNVMVRGQAGAPGWSRRRRRI